MNALVVQVVTVCGDPHKGIGRRRKYFQMKGGRDGRERLASARRALGCGGGAGTGGERGGRCRRRLGAADGGRRGWRGRISGEDRDAGGDRCPAQRRQRRRRSGRLSGRARSHGALLVRDWRRRLHGRADGWRFGNDDRRPRDGAGGDAPDVLLENGAPLPFNAARYSGLSVGVPGTVETWVDALENSGRCPSHRFSRRRSTSRVTAM